MKRIEDIWKAHPELFDKNHVSNIYYVGELLLWTREKLGFRRSNALEPFYFNIMQQYINYAT